MAVSLNSALGAFPVSALAGTGYVPLAGGTMTGALTLPAGALGTPSLMLDGAGATTGLYSTGANDISFAVNGSRRAYFSTSSFTSIGTIVGSGGLTVTNGNCGVVSASGAITWGTSGSADTYIYRDAAATLAQRNGTTQQIFRLYNTYTDASNYERLTLTGVAGTSVNLTAETLGTGGDNLDIVLTPAGAGRSRLITGAWIGNFPTYATSINIDHYGVSVIASGHYKWTSGIGTAVADTGLSRNAAGVVEVNSGTAGTFRDLKLRNLLNTEYHEMTEMTAPSAPATNSVRIYAEDNGSGKTRLMALFATGAAVQLGIEP